MANILSPREQQILAQAWLCFESEPKININKLATACGYTNPRSAGNAWSAIRKKLFAQLDANDAISAAPATSTPNKSQKPTKTTKSSPKKRGRVTEGDDDDVDDKDEESPTKKANKGKAKTTFQPLDVVSGKSQENREETIIKSENSNEENEVEVKPFQ